MKPRSGTVVSASIVIDRSPTDVWACLEAEENFTRLRPRTQRRDVTALHTGGQAATHVYRGSLRGDIEATSTNVEYTPGVRKVERFEAKGLVAVTTWSLEPVLRGTEVRLATEIVEGGGRSRVGSWISAWQMRRGFAWTLRTLKALTEGDPRALRRQRFLVGAPLRIGVMVVAALVSSYLGGLVVGGAFATFLLALVVVSVALLMLPPG
jgi:Polyketide cyclase / dehydrase and lipid transport